MEPPGPPPRTLTWEAMDQIRYLHKEFADSWSVSQLAEGFDVSTDVIRRVLKSKLVPTLKQKQKQDQKVLKKAGLPHLVQQPRGPKDGEKSLTAGYSALDSLLLPGQEALSRGQSHSSTLTTLESSTQSTAASQGRKGRNKGTQALEKESFVPITTASAHQREPKSSIGDYASTGSTNSHGLPSTDRKSVV